MSITSGKLVLGLWNNSFWLVGTILGMLLEHCKHGGWPSLEWLVTILGWWVIVLGMVDDHPGSGIWSSLAWWVPILGMVGDYPFDGGWPSLGWWVTDWGMVAEVLILWVKSTFKSLYFLVVDFGEGCSSCSRSRSHSCSCDRGKTKSTPSPFDLDWNGLGLEFDNKEKCVFFNLQFLT